MPTMLTNNKVNKINKLSIIYCYINSIYFLNKNSACTFILLFIELQFILR